MKLRHLAQRVCNWVVSHRRPLLIGLASLAVVSIAGQLVYPHGHAVPLAHVAGERVGWRQHNEVTLAVQERFNQATAQLSVDEQQVSEKLANLGARVDADAMASHVVDYPWLYRVLPFSIVWYQPGLDRYQLEFDDSRLLTVSQERADELSIEPIDAGLAIEDGELIVTAAEPGERVEPDALAEAVKTTRFGWDETAVEVPSTEVTPRVSDAAVASVKQQAETALQQQITIEVPGHDSVKLNRQDIAPWLTVNQAESGSLELAVDTAVLGQYLAKLRQATATQPTKTTVTTVDGRETDRELGRDGRGIAVTQLRQAIAARLLAQQSEPATLVANFETISSPVEYQRSYTSSQAGLSAYVKDITDEAEVQIAVKQLGRNGWSAEGRANESIASASTYKPYLMLRVLDDIKDRERRWDDRIEGETLSECFERMIVVSANECPEALIQDYGVQQLTDYLHNKGFSRGTGFTFSKVTQTTARDLAQLMEGIERSSLVSRQHRDMLLEKMGRQIFRQGIPAGTRADVYNKPGFLWNFLHDAAIVRHPKGSYVLVVMTEGESWAKVAEITRQIERIMYG